MQPRGLFPSCKRLAGLLFPNSHFFCVCVFPLIGNDSPRFRNWKEINLQINESSPHPLLLHFIRRWLGSMMLLGGGKRGNGGSGRLIGPPAWARLPMTETPLLWKSKKKEEEEEEEVIRQQQRQHFSPPPPPPFPQSE